jgi:hypothetical protein
MGVPRPWRRCIISAAAVGSRGKREVALLREHWADMPASTEDAVWLEERAFADSAYAFERIASAKVTIRPRSSSHSAWREARNPSARVSADVTAKHGCAPWQASSR